MAAPAACGHLRRLRGDSAEHEAKIVGIETSESGPSRQTSPDEHVHVGVCTPLQSDSEDPLGRCSL